MDEKVSEASLKKLFGILPVSVVRKDTNEGGGRVRRQGHHENTARSIEKRIHKPCENIMVWCHTTSIYIYVVFYSTVHP
jgi:hypothetical protein